MRVKVCGITNIEDAKVCVELGVYAIGFIFAKKSPRRITFEKAREIISSLPPFIQSVGVFVNEEYQLIEDAIRYCGLDLVQLHGDESPQICERLMPRVIKAIRVKDRSSLGEIEKYRGKVKAILLDTYVKEVEGGTGRSFDWSIAKEAKKFGIPIILSGGIGPDNIKEAIRTVNPFAVDINSKVEERPGKKSAYLLRRFMEELKDVVKESS